MVAFLTQKKDCKTKMDEKSCSILLISCYLGWAAPYALRLGRALRVTFFRSQLFAFWVVIG